MLTSASSSVLIVTASVASSRLSIHENLDDIAEELAAPSPQRVVDFWPLGRFGVVSPNYFFHAVRQERIGLPRLNNWYSVEYIPADCTWPMEFSLMISTDGSEERVNNAGWLTVEVLLTIVIEADIYGTALHISITRRTVSSCSASG